MKTSRCQGGLRLGRVDGCNVLYLRVESGAENRNDLKKEDELKNKDDLKNEGNLKNKDNLKN